MSMLHAKQRLGKWGEEQARIYLESSGLKFLEHNYRVLVGEIDLIMQDRETLVFVEVKTRRSIEYGPPEASITKAKQERIYKAAMDYLERNQKMEVDWRVDVIAIQCRPNYSIERIEHYPNIELSLP